MASKYVVKLCVRGDTDEAGRTIYDFFGDDMEADRLPRTKSELYEYLQVVVDNDLGLLSDADLRREASGDDYYDMLYDINFYLTSEEIVCDLPTRRYCVWRSNLAKYILRGRISERKRLKGGEK